MTEFQPQASSYVPQQASREPAAPQQPQHPQAPVASQWMEPTQAPAEPTFLVAQVPGQGAGPSHAAPGIHPPADFPAPPVYAAPYASPDFAQPAAAPQAPYASPTYAQPAYASAPPVSAPAAYGAGHMWAPAYAPAKKRKVWPWVVGGVGGMLVLGIGAVFAVSTLGNAAVDAVNPDYEGAPIEANDVAKNGGELVMADDGKVAFEIDPTWADEAAGVFGNSLDGGDVEITFSGAWSAPFESGQTDTSLIMVLAGPEKVPVTGALLDVEHEAYLSSFKTSLDDLTVTTIISNAEPYTTAGGLSGRSSEIQISVDGVPSMSGTLYTFARGRNLVYVQTLSTDVDAETDMGAIVLDTLRIDK